MAVYISLLRGINVGGKRMKMTELKAVYASLGLKDTETLLQSGNAVFTAPESDPLELAERIEKGIEAHFGFQSQIILRTREELMTAAQKHPYTEAQLAEPGKILVMFLADVPTDEAMKTLRDANTGPEEITLKGRELYTFYPEGIGRSKFTHALIEKKLKISGTARNWNTVQKLLALVENLND